MYTASSLGLHREEDDEIWDEDEVDSLDQPPDVELVKSVAELLPDLESLSLSSRWYGHSIYFCASSEPVPLEVRRCIPSKLLTSANGYLRRHLWLHSSHVGI